MAAGLLHGGPVPRAAVVVVVVVRFAYLTTTAPHLTTATSRSLRAGLISTLPGVECLMTFVRLRRAESSCTRRSEPAL